MMVLLVTIDTKVDIGLAVVHERVDHSPISWHHSYCGWSIVLARVLLLHHHEVRHVSCAVECTLIELIWRGCVSLSTRCRISKHIVIRCIALCLNRRRTLGSSTIWCKIHWLVYLLGRRFTSASLFSISLLLHLVIELWSLHLNNECVEKLAIILTTLSLFERCLSFWQVI